MDNRGSPKTFRFFNYWTTLPNFLGVVENSWKEDIMGSALFIFASKLKRLKFVHMERNTSHVRASKDEIDYRPKKNLRNGKSNSILENIQHAICKTLKGKQEKLIKLNDEESALR